MSNTLSVDLVYISPLGRRCMLVPGRSLPWLEFKYLDEPALGGPGFYLRRDQFHKLMREAPRQQMPWEPFMLGAQR